MSDLHTLHNAPPPNSLEMEQAVLGGMMIEPAACDVALAELQEDDLYRDAHRYAFRAMRKLRTAGHAVDMLTVKDALDNDGYLEPMGGFSYLLQLTEAVPTTANMAHYCRQVSALAERRRLIMAADAIRATALEGISDDVSGDSLRMISAAIRNTGGGLRHMGEVVHATMDDLEATAQSGAIRGITTGLDQLDYMLGGLQRDNLVIIAARPGMGKSVMGMGLARAAALAGHRVLVASLEMSAIELCRRMLLGLARVDAGEARNGRLGSPEWERLGRTAATLVGLPIAIADDANMSVAQLTAMVRRMGAETPDLIIVDHLGLMDAGRRTENKTQEIGEITRGLRILARDMHCPVVALCQLNRQVEGQKDRRPDLKDLRGSGDIEQDANVVMMLYRPAYYSEDKSILNRPHSIELIIRKQRNGPLGTALATFDPGRMEITEEER